METPLKKKKTVRKKKDEDKYRLLASALFDFSLSLNPNPLSLGKKEKKRRKRRMMKMGKVLSWEEKLAPGRRRQRENLLRRRILQVPYLVLFIPKTKKIHSHIP